MQQDHKALPVHLSEQANEALKSEYNLDFLGITSPILERQLENKLNSNLGWLKNHSCPARQQRFLAGSLYVINQLREQYFLLLTNSCSYPY